MSRDQPLKTLGSDCPDIWILENCFREKGTPETHCWKDDPGPHS